jgi:predicted metal-dependent enzyme (double-stranded beta helix superfamily)
MLLGSHSASVNSVTKGGGKKLAGKFLIIGRIRSFVAFFACFHAIEVTMFETDRFVADCRAAFAQDQTHKAVREVLARAVSDPAAVLKGLGEPSRAQIQELFHSDTLTILNVVWAPGMMVMPHNHRMWAAIGIYAGREDNVFWRRVKGTSNKIEAAGARALCEMDAEPLGADVIHSVINPINKLTGAIHIYGGDFFAAERSEWDSETLLEHPWEGERARRVFEEANARYEASKQFRTS